jgi:hypothetical protein
MSCESVRWPTPLSPDEIVFLLGISVFETLGVDGSHSAGLDYRTVLQNLAEFGNGLYRIDLFADMA